MLISAVVTTTDGGLTWQLRPLPADIPNPQLTTLSCASSTLCWLGGQEAVPVVIGNVHNDGSPVLLGTTNGGSSWEKVTFTVPPGAPNYDGQSYLSIGLIGCPSTQACVALGGAAQGSEEHSGLQLRLECHFVALWGTTRRTVSVRPKAMCATSVPRSP